MRQELEMIKTSPRKMVGYGGDTTSAVLESPTNAISDVYSAEGASAVRQSTVPLDQQPTPVRKHDGGRLAALGSLSPQRDVDPGFFMTQDS